MPLPRRGSNSTSRGLDRLQASLTNLQAVHAAQKGMSEPAHAPMAGSEAQESAAATDGAELSSIPLEAAELQDGTLCQLPIDQIHIADVNVRLVTDADPDLVELAQSMQERGLLQPIVVGVDRGQYILIAGERRLRAARQLGWTTIPAVVTLKARPEWAIDMLVENIQRKQLDPWEEAQGYRRLLDQGWSLRQIARRVAKSPGYISVVLKLMSYPAIRAALEARTIPSLSLAMELNRLMTTDGTPIQPGVLDAAIDFIRRAKPTQAELREWVHEALARIEAERPVPPGRSHARRRPTSFLRREVQRWQVIRERELPQLSALELRALRSFLEEQLTFLTHLEGEQSGKAPQQLDPEKPDQAKALDPENPDEAQARDGV